MKKLSDILMELKDYSLITYEHSIRVANICMMFGRRLGLTDEEVKTLKMAGLLHDIGKLKIPKEILDKPSKLTKEEYEKIKMHPRYGVDLLMRNGFNDTEVLNSIMFHHERIDGLGYPYGLDGNNIPKLAQILVVCDCFDAMNSKRPYHEAEGINYIRNEFINNSGTQFSSYYAKEMLLFLDSIVKEREMRRKK